ncbi:MAG: hypothetical protein ACE5NM_14130, partial [Sedimentisphaerales bacterium]
VSTAFASAESGLEVMRYWLSHIRIPKTTAPTAILSTITAALQNDLTNNGISNITVNYDGSKINVPSVTLATAQNCSFTVEMRQIDDDTIQLDVTGINRQINRTIRVDFNIEPYEHPIFNYGLATKGPLNFPGNPTITAANSAWEADMYIESSGSAIGVSVGGNTNFDGDVNIGNPDASVTFGGDVQIAGDYGQEAIDNHVSIGVDSPEFPEPDVSHFLQYATGDIIDSSTDLSKGITLVNATIKAGTNPVFGGSVTVQGILLIESPNKVTFSRNVTLQGIIIADGDIHNPDPGTNRIDFCGNFDTGPYPNDPQFDAIRHEIGSSVIGPGFATTFGGNFSTLEGVMAVSGVHFYGNASALIKGTIINYSDNATIVEGNVTMNFDRAGTTKIPAGFDTTRVLRYEPLSYTIIL